MNQPEQYQLYQIIWAKVRGYQWWPGMIIEIKRQKPLYKVFFIQGTHSYLEPRNIKKYTPGSRSKFKTNMNPGLKEKLQLEIKFYDALFEHVKENPCEHQTKESAIQYLLKFKAQFFQQKVKMQQRQDEEQIPKFQQQQQQKKNYKLVK